MTTRRILVIIENVAYARDHRARKQVESLLRSGYRVGVISRRDPDDHRYRSPGLRIYEYKAPPERPGLIGFALEYGYSLIAATALMARARRHGRVRPCPDRASAGHLLPARGPGPVAGCSVRGRPARPLSRGVRGSVRKDDRRDTEAAAGHGTDISPRGGRCALRERLAGPDGGDAREGGRREGDGHRQRADAGVDRGPSADPGTSGRIRASGLAGSG